MAVFKWNFIQKYYNEFAVIKIALKTSEAIKKVTQLELQNVIEEKNC